MKVVIQNTMQQAGLAGWQLLLALAVFLTSCGGRGLRGIGGDAAIASGGGGAGGTETGGVGGVFSGGGASGTGGTEVVTGGATSQGGSARGGQDGSAAQGGSSATGGVGGSSSGGGASSAGGTGVATGGAASQGGSAGGGQDGGAPDGETMASPDALCQPADLWDAITSAMCGPRPVFCMCYPTPDGGGVIQGVVNLDSEGRVVDNTRLSGANRQAWLDALANERWPCLAGQAVPYSCDFVE